MAVPPCARLGLATLPEQFRVVGHGAVIAIALTMYLVEFIADKVAWGNAARRRFRARPWRQRTGTGTGTAGAP